MLAVAYPGQVRQGQRWHRVATPGHARRLDRLLNDRIDAKTAGLSTEIGRPAVGAGQRNELVPLSEAVQG